MKKMKGSISAKIAAWIGITISGVVFAGSVLGSVLMWDAGIYENAQDKMLDQAFESVSEQYSIRALDNWINVSQRLIEEPYFHYGIIKAEKIDDLDLNKDSTYLAQNFTEQVSKENVYINSYEVGENTQFSYSGTLWGGYSTYNSAPTYLTSEQIYGIVYNEDDGIFYYETPGDIFPVLRLTASYNGMVFDYDYDFTKKMYRNMNVVAAEYQTDEMETTIEVSEGEDVAEETNAYITDIEQMLYLDYISFNMLEEIGYNITDIEWQMFDGVDDWGLELQVVNSAYLEGKAVTTETDYYPNGNILEMNYTDEDNLETYWVVFMKPESVGTGWSNNLFVQANQLINLAYGLRYSIYVIMLAAVCLGIVCFVFLIAAAGHRKGTDEIEEAAIDILPFDIYLVLAGFLAFFLVQMMVECSYLLSSPSEYVLLGILALCICWVALETVLTFVVRIKTKRLWTNTVICRILKWAGRGIRFFMENLPILWKAILLVGLVFFVDFIMTLAAGSYGGAFALFWFIEKAALAAVIFIGVVQMKQLQEGGEKLAEGDLNHQIDTEKMFWDFKEHGENLNRISEGMSHAVDERMKSERFKTELITNVSHDIKTPLTSIINYVDLLEKEELKNETAEEYLEVLERQSARLKKLIEDLIEASKASSGSLAVHPEKLEAGVFLTQTVGEFEEKTRANDLELLIKKPEDTVYIMADGRHFWRIIDNLMNNICKYAQPSTRVYINMEVKEEKVYITFRNTSKYPLNISSEELMERFVRGDDSRNTEGSGLGISIAKSLTELMGGTFRLSVDGDLFKVELAFSISV